MSVLGSATDSRTPFSSHVRNSRRSSSKGPTWKLSSGTGRKEGRGLSTDGPCGRREVPFGNRRTLTVEGERVAGEVGARLHAGEALAHAHDVVLPRQARDLELLAVDHQVSEAAPERLLDLQETSQTWPLMVHDLKDSLQGTFTGNWTETSTLPARV